MSRFRIAALVPLAALLSAPAPAQVDWNTAPHLEVVLASFRYEPRQMQLHADQPVILDLHNTSSGGHDFTAPELFAASTLRPEDEQFIEAGSIEVPRGENLHIGLVPKAGHYRVKCTHAFHRMLGMSGEVVVS